MKPRISPIYRERLMRDDDIIVSKADTSGRITCANRVFMAFAGYTESELLGRQQNIVRHPDMPRALFYLM
jgi:PAS domain S-box-containing protein